MNIKCNTERTIKISYRMPTFLEGSLVGSMLAYWRLDNGSNLWSDISNKTKYEENILKASSPLQISGKNSKSK